MYIAFNFFLILFFFCNCSLENLRLTMGYCWGDRSNDPELVTVFHSILDTRITWNLLTKLRLSIGPNVQKHLNRQPSNGTKILQPFELFSLKELDINMNSVRVFVFPSPRPSAWPPAPNLSLPALASNLSLPALAPNFYLPALVSPSLGLQIPTLPPQSVFTGPGL